MSWSSLLPAHLTTIETWIVRFFLFLGIITITPWILALLYDMVLYLVRAATYEVPYYGGRAQGRRKPQPPTLTERPNGRKRTFSINGITSNSGADKEAGKRRSFDSSDGEGANDITEEESRAIYSTDLWDASTDSRFIDGVNTTKKRK